jgi:hypothetical protein
MATSSPLGTTSPQESNNPGDEEFDKLIEHNYSPEEKERLKQIADARPPDSEGQTPSSQPSSDNLSASEQSAAGNNSGHIYRPGSPHEFTRMRPSLRGVTGFARTNRGKVFIGGAAASLITLLIVGFFAVLPFKILHIMNNLQSHFFSTSENAMTKETDVLFSNYVKKYVLPGITRCGNTINKDCSSKAVGGTGLVSQLYRGWSNAKLENKLAENYGMEFRYQKSTGHFFLRASGTEGNGVDLGTADSPDGFIKSTKSLDDEIATSKDPQFKRVSRSEVRQAVRDSLSGETKFKQVMYRFKVGRLLEEKYGIKRCIIACTAQDNFADWKNQKKVAAKALVAQRILRPRGEMVGLVIECLTDPNCDPTKIDTSGVCTADENCESNGEDTSAVEKDVQSKLDALAAKDGEESVADIIKLYNDLEEKGFTQFTIEQVLAVILDEDAAQAAGQTADKALPVVGWINLAAQVVGDVNSAPGKIQKLTYITNSSTMVASFAMYRTYADEIKNGHVDASIVGAFTDTLGPNSKSTMGGTAEAEQTPLYSKLIGNGKYAGASNYKCNDGKLVAAGQGTCSELQLNNTSQLTAALQNIKSGIPFFGEIAGLASLWNSTLGKVISIIGNLINYIIPQLAETVGAVISKVAGPLIQAVANFIIPPIVSDNMSGGRTFDVVAGGADVSANDYAHNGLGGQELSGAQQAAILNQQQELDQPAHTSLYARLFDTSSDNSLITKVAMATPLSFAGAKSSIAALFSNPLAGFSGLFPSGLAHAAAGADPFGITQYGYPLSDPSFSADPETFWDRNCSTDGTTMDPNLPLNKNYRSNITINPDTQMPENTSTDPCYLIQAAVGSDGGLFDSGLLTQDDLAASGTPPTETGSQTGGGNLPTGTSEQLAQQLLPFISQGKIFCGPAAGGSGSANCSDIQNTAKGQPLGGNCQVKALTPHLLGLILGLVRDKGWRLGISAICSDHHLESDGPYGGHSYGSVADFSVQNRSAGLAAATDEQFVNDVAGLLSSTGGSFGQVATGGSVDIGGGGCHLVYNSQKNPKFTLFEDGCTHQHVRAAP